MKKICAILAALAMIGSLTVSASADSLKRVDKVMYRYSDSGENLGEYTGFAKTEDGRRWYYKKGVLVKDEWIETDSGKRYYAAGDGALLTGKKAVGNKVYTFDRRGRWDGEEPVTIGKSLGISFTLTEQTDSEITAEITLDPDFPIPVSYGTEYRLLKKNGKKWEEVKLLENVAFTDIGLEINPGETVTVHFSPRNTHGELSKGKYRICKTFDISGNERKTAEVFLTFTVSE